jgi:membrane protease subunit HflC
MVYVGWRITDPMIFFPKFAGGSVTEAEKTLEGILRSAKSGIVGRHPLSDFINVDEKQLKFDAIENEIKGLVQSQLQSNNYGIQVEFLGIKKLGLPESVTQAVFDQMTQERQRLVNKAQYEGEAEAQTIRSAAERKAAEMLAAAEGEATRIRGKGEEEALASLRTFERNPELANFILGLRALEQSLKERSTLILDQRTPPFNLLQGVATNRPSSR